MLKRLTGESPAINRSKYSDMSGGSSMIFARFLVLVGVTVCIAGPAAWAEDVATFKLTLKDHAFVPAEVKVAAGKPFKLMLHNSDSTPAEFESKTLKFEKVVAGSGEVTVNVRALKPGRYQFYDEYHEDQAVGYVIAN